MLSVKLNPLILSVNLISLIVNDISSIYHPEVEINVDFELLSPWLLRFICRRHLI